MDIAFVVDRKGWVQHDRAKLLKKILPYNIDIFTKKQSIGKKFKSYDAVYFLNALLVDLSLRHKNILTSITSHKTARHCHKYVDRCARHSANSKLLYELTKKMGQCFYIPNGVDTDFFSFHSTKISGKPVIGWVGNKDRAAKNFYLIKRLSSYKHLFEMKKVVTRKSNGKVRNQKEMLDFYRKLDFFLVCSKEEGTPNPALEAASCGVPVISTKVGNMREIIRPGVNGYFIIDNVVDMLKVINVALAMSYENYVIMRTEIRDTIKREWDWKNRINSYKSFIGG